jgi:hypothetical protein
VEHSAAVAELAGNPLLLTILSIIGRRRELPRERRNVYEHAVSVLVEHWDATGKHLSEVRGGAGMPYLEYEDKLELLHLVARHMQDGPAGLAGNYIAGQDLRYYFDAFLRDRFELPPERSVPAAKAMLGQLRERNFILARFGGGAYGFVHRVFLEYLAADDIRQQFSEHKMTQDGLLGMFGQHWNDPAWQEVLLLVTGMISEAFAAEVINRLLAADAMWYLRSDPVPRHVVLALQCLGEVRKLGGLGHQSHAVARAIASLLEEAASTSDYHLANVVVETLEKSAVPVFTSLGEHWAGLGRYQHWYLTRGQFLRQGYGLPVAAVAARLYVALLLRNDYQTRRHLITLAASGPVAIRAAAVEALVGGWGADPATGELLRERATTDTSEYVRRTAMQALASGWGADPATAELLHERATTDTSENVRHAAMQPPISGPPRAPN